MSKEARTIAIPRGMVVVPEDDPVRVRLDWRTGLVKLMLQHKKEESNGEKEEESK